MRLFLAAGADEIRRTKRWLGCMVSSGGLQKSEEENGI